MMYMMTEQEHMKLLSMTAYSHIGAYSMLKAMQPVSHPKTETPREANAGAGSLSQREKMLLEALKEAEMSLRTIELQSGRDEYLNDMVNIRGYACSRGSVARAAITAVEGNKE
jgi:hypothetical protein